MGKNVGSIDRILRIVVGLVLIALVFVGPQTPWGWIGIVPLATAALGWCPLYRVIGVNTCGIRSTHQAKP
jgi:Inner membrane protein YgaP-like, transmembrane domain